MSRTRAASSWTATASRDSTAHPEVIRSVRWWAAQPTQVPFYCDQAKIGGFAITPAELAHGSERALFRLFVSLSMYQALRDVVIMQRQRSLPPRTVDAIAGLATIGRSIDRHRCPALASATALQRQCTVLKQAGTVDCTLMPGARCPVKTATVAFNRTADMGQLPASAWLTFWKDGGLTRLLAAVCAQESSPDRRATVLVRELEAVHRIGRKLATLFVSALSTPALAQGLAPWSPQVDGNSLVVVDTNVARAADRLRRRGAPKTYDARERWVQTQASCLDLRAIRPDLPRHSPRVVQEALYAFCSKSNRIAGLDRCADREKSCNDCATMLCPFAK